MEINSKSTSILTTILSGLEKMKLLISSYYDFDFCSKLSFKCRCEKSNTFHVAVYNQKFDKLVCEISDFIDTPNGHQQDWLKGGQFNSIY